MANYTDISDTRDSLSVAITPSDINSAESALLADVYSAFNTLAYYEPYYYEFGYDYAYLDYFDGTEVWLEATPSSSGFSGPGSLDVTRPDGFYLGAEGTINLNVNTGNLSAKLSEFELGNDFYAFTYSGSLAFAVDGSVTGTVTSFQFTRTTADPSVWEAIIFTGKTKFDAYGNLTGTITGVEVGFYDVDYSTPTADDDHSLVWNSLGKMSGLKVSTASLDSMASYDSLFALNLSGNDNLTGTAGDDYIDASTGNDKVDGLAGNDVIYGGAGNDKLTDMLGNNYLDGGDGNNTIMAGAGDDIIYAGAGKDKINAGDGANLIDAGDGNNTITSGAGDDTIYAGSGNDKINAGDGANLIDAGDGNNTITAGAGDDIISTGAGNDRINAGDGANLIDAGDGNNTIMAGAGDDTIYTGSGNDKINAGDGVNVVFAGAGNDKITAGSGDDWIVSGAGADKIAGGLGTDYFVFDNLAEGGFDTISDFAAADDMLMFDTSVFTALAGGITADNLYFGAAAQDANDFLIFNAKGGKLYYDADGNGDGAAIQIAVLKGSVTGLAEGNFDVLV